MVKVDFENPVLDRPEGVDKKAMLSVAENSLREVRSGKLDMTGWVDWPNEIPEELISDIKACAADISAKSDRLVVIGIGGSFLGAKCVLDILGNSGKTKVDFIGYSFSSRMMNELLDKLKEDDFSVLVISKSGGTAETVTTFSVLRKALADKYGKEEAAKRTYMIIGAKKAGDESYLRKLADTEGIRTFDMPEDIGGRYSVFTTVGLLPIAAAGIDISRLIEGARKASSEDVYLNGGLEYACARNRAYAEGEKVEVFEFFDPYLDMFGEWLKQLFGESEGKDGKGLFPASLVFSRDLHSMGQFLQQGDPSFFETVIMPESYEGAEDVAIPDDAPEPFAGKTLNGINDSAIKGVIKAHASRGTQIIKIRFPKEDAESVGYLLYWFMTQCAVSALMSGVDPFNQPGVEDYKREMREAL